MEITGGALAEDIYCIYLSENAGTFFGVRPILGRNIEPSDGENGGHSVVVLNYRFWQRHFGGDSHVVGQMLEINHVLYTIIGVMPRSFAFNDTTGVGDVYLPGSLRRGIVNVPFLAYCRGSSSGPASHLPPPMPRSSPLCASLRNSTLSVFPITGISRCSPSSCLTNKELATP